MASGSGDYSTSHSKFNAKGSLQLQRKRKITESDHGTYESRESNHHNSSTTSYNKNKRLKLDFHAARKHQVEKLGSTKYQQHTSQQKRFQSSKKSFRHFSLSHNSLKQPAYGHVHGFSRQRKRCRKQSTDSDSDSIPGQSKRRKFDSFSVHVYQREQNLSVQSRRNGGQASLSTGVQSHQKSKMLEQGGQHKMLGCRSLNQSSSSKRTIDRDSSWMKAIVNFTPKYLMSLAELPTEELVEKLSNEIKSFQYTLTKKTLFSKSGVMGAIIKILSKVADPATLLNEAQHKACLLILAEVLSERCAIFQFHLKMYIKHDLGSEKVKHRSSNFLLEEIQCVCKLFYNILQALPSSSRFWLPMEDLQSAVKQLRNSSSKEALLNDIDALLHNLDEVRQVHLRKNEKDSLQAWNNYEFKEIEIIPHWNEVCSPEKPCLRENITTGSYSDWLHYYDIQFRLLREDFVAPLRKGICNYLDGETGRNLSNIRIYKKVLLKEPLFKSPHGVCYKIKITHVSSHINWEHSKSLLHGSLLCLTPENDNFKHEIFFATVIYREPSEMAMGELVIMFKKNVKMLSYSYSGTLFTMIESCAYFEASQHILHSLQTAEADTMPFTKYLVKCDFSSVEQPHYLTVNPESEYNLSSILTKDANEHPQDDSSDALSDGEIVDDAEPPNMTAKKDCFFVKPITDFQQWPTCDRAGLDTSQLEGIRMALTQEIAVIQGPPGTGKTYIGLKIIEALLSNTKACNPYGAKSPILIMCLTNHALDQFLEGILKSPLYKDTAPSLIRVGGRSQSKELAKFNLVEVRKNVYLPYYVRKDKKFAERAVKKFVTSKINRFISASNTYELASLEMLKKYEVICPEHYSQLFDLAKTHSESLCVLEMWLGLETSNKNWNKTIDSVLSDFEMKFPAPDDHSLSSLTNIKGPTSEGKQADEKGESSTDSLIDVVGDAVIEQSNRILDDEHHSDSYREEVFHHFESNFKECKKRCLHFDEERARKIFKCGFSFQPMSEKESRDTQNIHDLTFENRWRLYLFWHSQYLKLLCEECEEDFLKYNELCSVQANVRKTADCFALETADIIGMTTTGVAKYQQILHHIKPRIIIVEEAAEVLESHIVSALNAGTQHLILIGDHKQLRPKPNEYELETKYHLDISLFERLIHNGFPCVTLECQHRMRPEIAELIKPHIYSVLSNHSSVKDYPSIRGVSKNLFFIKHEIKEEEHQNLLSHSNYHEANYLVSLCRYLLQQRYTHEQITILVTYTGQLQVMRKLMPKSEFEGVKVCTVDNFQGEENDIILLSLVRSNKEENVGFLNKSNRVCVALSRARQGFYCIGNFDILRKKVSLWEDIMADIEKKGKLGDGLPLCCSNHPENKFTAKLPKDFQQNSPEGGCLQDCTFRLECGHVCAQKCHYTDPEHTSYRCKKKCTKSCSEGHPCHKFCYEECGNCAVRVSKVMPHCEHTQVMPCYKDPAEVVCYKQCKKKCPKEHSCPLKCHQECQPCEVKIPIIMPTCQHKQWIKCHQDPQLILCKAKCPLSCAEGHPCRKLCFQECGKCTEPVRRVIPVCNHEVLLPCYVEPSHNECSVPCEKLLPCNHRCQLKCGEDCYCTQIVTTELPDCGHKAQVPCYKLQNLSSVCCDKECKLLLSCGHWCNLICSEPCQTQCMVFVNKTWPCGHKLKRPCYQSLAPEEYPCTEKCTKKFDCGHPCSKGCGQTCDDKCKYICSHILSCGHKCRGNCYQCTAEHMHKLCPFSRQFKRFCGHSFQTTCSGLVDEHSGNQKQLVICSHVSKKVNCYDRVLHNCNEECLWNCEHFTCSKRCSEICDRPRCNQRCPLKLKCGHRCHGLCGELCLTLCPQCQHKEFTKNLEFANCFSRDNLYYELPCKHIFSVQYLDEYVHQLTDLQSHVLVGPIQCPIKECSHPLSCSYRYGNAVKQSLSFVQDVSTIVSEKESEQDRMFLAHQLERIRSNELFSSIKWKCGFQVRSSIPSDAKYLIFILTKAMDVYEALVNHSPPPTTNNDSILEGLKNFLSFVSSHIINRPTKLTFQVVDDLQGEFFRLYLESYIRLAKCTNNPPLSKSTIDKHSSVTLTAALASYSMNLEASSDLQSESDCLLDSSLYSLRTFYGDKSSHNFKSDHSSKLSKDSPKSEGTLGVHQSESDYAEPDHNSECDCPLEFDSEESDCNSSDHQFEFDNAESDQKLDSDCSDHQSKSGNAQSNHNTQTSIDDDQSEGQLLNSSSSLVDLFANCAHTSATVNSTLIVPLPLITPADSEDNESASLNSRIAAGEEYLKNVAEQNLQVSKVDIQTHCGAIGGHLHNTSRLDYKKLIQEIDRFYPVVQKGQWWRCPKGDYFCVCPSSSHDNLMKCPKCSVIYKSYQVLPKKEAFQNAMQDQPNEDRTSSYHQSPEHQHYRRGPEQNIGKCHSRGNYHGQSDRRHFVGLPYTHDLRQSLYQARKGQWLQGRQSYKKVKNVSIFDRLGSRRESVFDRLGNCKHGQKQ